MDSIKKFWKGNIFNKLVLLISPIAGLCVCCIGLVLILPSSPQIPAPIPTFDQNSLLTSVYQTAIFSIQETQTAFPSETPQPTSTVPPLPTFTETPTLIPFATSTLFSSNVTIFPKAVCVPDTQPQTGKVVDVVDGDTIKVMLDSDGLVYSVRYIGIDTPESTIEHEYFGKESSAKNQELVYGKPVTLYKDVSETDRYNRLLRYIFIEDKFINYELVAQGYANSMEYPPDIACASYFNNAENTAMAANLGLWAAQPAPIVQATNPPSNSPSSNATCTCSSNSYNCKDFSSRSAAQSCFEYCNSVGAGDVHRLDSDSDNRVCESMP